MKRTKYTLLMSLGIGIFSGPSVSNAQSQSETPGTIEEWSEPGGIKHYYQVFTTTLPQSWEAAESSARGKTEFGVSGHLVTITSAAENEFVTGLLERAVPTSLPADRYWIGGYQLSTANTAFEHWYLLNGEGGIPQDADMLGYENWGTNALGDPEPDDPNGENDNLDEDFLAFAPSGQWFSEALGAPVAIKGYIVEYDTGRPGDPATGEGVIDDPESDCTAKNTGNAEDDGCYTIPEQKLILPASTVFGPDDPEIRFRSWRFKDPRVDDDGKCNVDRKPLDVFAELEPDDSDSDSARNGELIFQEFLCGSPYFVVVLTDAYGITIPEGTVHFEHWRLQGNLFNCEPADPNDSGDPSYDLQSRDTPTWRSIEPGTTLEEEFGTRHGQFPGVADGSWDGSVSERTTGCRNPSGGDSESKSYYVLGLHTDFGSYPASENKFKDLASYKIEMLTDSVNDAVEIDNENDRNVLRNEAEKANVAVNNDLQEAQCHVQHFLEYAENDTEYTYNGNNDSGIHEARGRNILFLLEKMIRYFTPNSNTNTEDFVCPDDTEDDADADSDSDSDSDADSDSDSDFWRKTKKR